MMNRAHVFFVALFLAVLAASPATATEEPAFVLDRRDGDFEIRSYGPVIEAETTVAGGAERARNAGFHPLADYIFANDRKGGKIAMTAPVTQTPRKRIAMTAPVTQESASDGWIISFTMPAGYTMETLPPPGNPAVRLVAHAARKMAVVRFSGLAGREQMDKKRTELLEKVSKSGLWPVGEPIFAFYDPPWTLPWARRNEVMVEIQAH
jgi:hypothetical protein